MYYAKPAGHNPAWKKRRIGPKGLEMASIDSETWRMNIENAADEVRSHYGNETVESIFRSYEATCFDDLNSSDYERIFSDFQQLINDKWFLRQPRWLNSPLRLPTYRKHYNNIHDRHQSDYIPSENHLGMTLGVQRQIQRKCLNIKPEWSSTETHQQRDPIKNSS